MFFSVLVCPHVFCEFPSLQIELNTENVYNWQFNLACYKMEILTCRAREHLHKDNVIFSYYNILLQNNKQLHENGKKSYFGLNFHTCQNFDQWKL